MSVEERLWGARGRTAWIVIAAAFLILCMLGSGALWTQEGRWALICEQMHRSGDVMHPSLLGEPYFGKPLLSYWTMLVVASVTGTLDELALRLPSAISGILAIWCTARVGRHVFGASTGRAAATVLATSYMFVFWSRVASADMMNTAGMMLAVLWYFEFRNRPGLVAYLGFFCILAVASLAKSPAAAVLAMLAIGPDLLREGRWRQFLDWRLFASVVPAAVLYLTPFLLLKADQGLGSVFRETLVRYFAPFDHTGPFYIYFYYLPIYLLPWGLCLPWLLCDRWRRRRELTKDTRWAMWAVALGFLFLMGCGSRRSYYILPVLPFAALVVADWLVANERRLRVAARLAITMFLVFVVWFGVGVPWSETLPSSRRAFAAQVHSVAEEHAPWLQWRVLSCDAVPSSAFYLHAREEPQVADPEQLDRITAALLAHPHTLVVSRRRHLEALRTLLPGARVIEQLPNPYTFEHAGDKDLLVALVPLGP
jgi:4-amino-4-deoxy-L-arabinose transferase-like glycosyltransferase